MPLTRPDTTVPGKSISPTLGGGPFSTGGRGNGPGQAGGGEPGQAGDGGDAVKIILSHRIALDPTPSQKSILRQAVGCARFAYNWALREWQDQYEQGGRPNERELRRFLNNLKPPVESKALACRASRGG